MPALGTLRSCSSHQPRDHAIHDKLYWFDPRGLCGITARCGRASSSPHQGCRGNLQRPLPEPNMTILYHDASQDSAHKVRGLVTAVALVNDMRLVGVGLSAAPTVVLVVVVVVAMTVVATDLKRGNDKAMSVISLLPMPLISLRMLLGCS